MNAMKALDKALAEMEKEVLEAGLGKGGTNVS
jgi:hypothetical protein